jgi:hypothetical protein
MWVVWPFRLYISWLEIIGSLLLLSFFVVTGPEDCVLLSLGNGTRLPMMRGMENKVGNREISFGFTKNQPTNHRGQFLGSGSAPPHWTFVGLCATRLVFQRRHKGFNLVSVWVRKQDNVIRVEANPQLGLSDWQQSKETILHRRLQNFVEAVDRHDEQKRGQQVVLS